jgi:putative tryptophan/tyrosine transport system substrate-binding protein
MSYGPSYVDLFRRAADYVHRILQGAKTGDMRIEQPTRFELVLNLTTARALGLRVSEPFLSLRPGKILVVAEPGRAQLWYGVTNELQG